MAGEKILILEDDPALLEGLRDILVLAGYRVTMASNGVEGLAALEKDVPHLIISDIMMPRLDGYRFYEAVRARTDWVHVPFIFLTAKGDKADVRRGKQLGVDDYLVKPFDEEDLLVVIRAKLARRAQLDAVRDYQIAGLKRSILTTLNHEIRTPLTYISTYTDMLRETDAELSSEEFKQLMRGIKIGTERLRGLVEDFTLLVELQSGEAQRIFERRRRRLEDLPTLLQAVLGKYAARAAARRINLTADVPNHLPAVQADPEYLSDAVGRLMDNALKFSKREGGQVTLRAHAVGNRVRLEVRDEGIGIRIPDLEKIFDVFYQIDRAKLEQQGSGSGLAIARGIVALHDGSLTVQSEFGMGSTFTLELPQALGPEPGSQTA